MNIELKRARDRANQARQDVELAVYDSLKLHIGGNFSFTSWTNSVVDAYKSQWCNESRRQNGGWDWEAIGHDRRPPKDHILAVKIEERLSILSYLRVSRERIKVEIVEADPRSDCPLKGKRLAIVLEYAVMYGQRLGCNEIHIEPLNDGLKELYTGVYGFVEVKKRKSLEYLKKDLV